MEMMSPERQKVNPFFLGGESDQRLLPDRRDGPRRQADEHARQQPPLLARDGHHELIPGPSPAEFMNARYNTHRARFAHAVLDRGLVALLGDAAVGHGFPQTPENTSACCSGACTAPSRIIFSLSFHLGNWTPDQCIDFLVDKGGHERANAEAEVRRSFNGSYPPLYQLAYMMGGLQFNALHDELVGKGKR